MTFDPKIFLDVASRIKESNDLNEQGKIRTVIGRAYYAAFLTAREHLRKFKGIRFERERQHQDVIDALENLNEHFLKNELDTLRDFRITADYKLNYLLDENLCVKSIVISEDLINSIERI